MTVAGQPKAMLQRAALWGAPFVLMITVFVVPVTDYRMKAFQIALLVVTMAGWMLVSRAKVRILIGCVLLGVSSLFLLPSRDATSRRTLPETYRGALLHYEGTIYWWGGENKIGIDCSGLIRRGMIDAMLREGLLKVDGGLLRDSADLWWHDTSAEALGEGYRGYTMALAKAANLNELDHSLINAGDLAIAGGGSHILAYLGEKRWIQADPNAGKVIVESIPSSNGWFKGPVRIVRWKWMASPNQQRDHLSEPY